MRTVFCYLLFLVCISATVGETGSSVAQPAKFAIGIRDNTDTPPDPLVPEGQPLITGDLDTLDGEAYYWGVRAHGWVVLPSPPGPGAHWRVLCTGIVNVLTGEVPAAAFGTQVGFSAWNGSGTAYWTGWTMFCWPSAPGVYSLPSGVYAVEYTLQIRPAGGGWIDAAACTGYFGW